MSQKLKYIYLNFSRINKRYQTSFTLIITGFILFAGNALFGWLMFPYFKQIFNLPTDLSGEKYSEVISFAPEAWLGLLGLVLGTLIIVISVASQSTPKLIDLYTGDQTSLFYIWFIIIGSVHNMYLQLEYVTNFKVSTIIFNTYIMLPLALLLAVPYVLYILRYTKTSNVIKKIYNSNEKRIQKIAEKAKLGMLKDPKVIADYQFELFEALNQLDDLLEYVDFKEPKGDVMERISLSIQGYIRRKETIRKSPEFFRISNKIRPDVSFKTMTGQFEEMREKQTFYEQKGFRLLGNAYIKLIEKEDFDLASLCAFELSQCGKVAVDCKDEALMEVVLIRFNTLMRFGIKHGLKNKEARNLYNAIFHYSGYIRHIIQSRNEQYIRRSCQYLNIYVKEIFNHSRKEPVFTFLVDVFTWEFKRLLTALCEENLPISLQKEILGLFLKIDNLPDLHETRPDQNRRFNSGVRVLQIALALYYLKVEQEALTESIIIDILSDHEQMEKEELQAAVQRTCDSLNSAAPTFWEDTDRGNLNIYYSEDKEYIEAFMEKFKEMHDYQNLLNRRNRPTPPPGT